MPESSYVSIPLVGGALLTTTTLSMRHCSDKSIVKSIILCTYIPAITQILLLNRLLFLHRRNENGLFFTYFVYLKINIPKIAILNLSITTDKYVMRVTRRSSVHHAL